MLLSKMMQKHRSPSRWAVSGADAERQTEPNDSSSGSCICESLPKTSAISCPQSDEAQQMASTPSTCKDEDYTNRFPSITTNLTELESLVGRKHHANTVKVASSRIPLSRGQIYSFVPSSRFLYIWSGFISVLCLYNVWIIAYRHSFDEIQSETIKIWFTLDYIADFFYLLDIAIGFHTTFLEDGILQKDPARMRKNYMNSTRFYVDCLCLLPLDFLYLSIGLNSIVRIFRVVKIYKLWEFVARAERQVCRSNILKLGKSLCFKLTFIHWNACLYRWVMDVVGFPKAALFGETETKNLLQSFTVPLVGNLSAPEHTRSEVENFSANVTSIERPFLNYMNSVFWSMRCLVLLHPPPPPTVVSESIYGYFVFEALLGIILIALFLSNLNITMSTAEAAHYEFQGRLDEVKRYLAIRKAPDKLQRKVVSWFDYLWRQSHIPDEQRVFKFLPDRLRAEIAIHVHLDTLKRVDIFQNTEEGFLSELVLRLKPALYSPGDFICRKGQIGRQMFFVSQGKLEVLGNDGSSVIANLCPGSYFGEISILNLGNIGNRRTASVRSIGYSDLFCLSKEDLWDVIKEYPAAKEKLENVAFQRLQTGKIQNLFDTCGTYTVDNEMTAPLNRAAAVSPSHALMNRKLAVSHFPSDGNQLSQLKRRRRTPGFSSIGTIRLLNTSDPTNSEDFSHNTVSPRKALQRQFSLQYNHNDIRDKLPFLCSSDGFMSARGNPQDCVSMTPDESGWHTCGSLLPRKRKNSPLSCSAPRMFTFCRQHGCHSSGDLLSNAHAISRSRRVSEGCHRWVPQIRSQHQNQYFFGPGFRATSPKPPSESESISMKAAPLIETLSDEAIAAGDTVGCVSPHHKPSSICIPQIRFERAATPGPVQFCIPEDDIPISLIDNPTEIAPKTPDSINSLPATKQHLQLPFHGNTNSQNGCNATSSTNINASGNMSYASSSLSLQCSAYATAGRGFETNSPVEQSSPNVADGVLRVQQPQQTFIMPALNQQLIDLQKRVSSLESENRSFPCMFYNI